MPPHAVFSIGTHGSASSNTKSCPHILTLGMYIRSLVGLNIRTSLADAYRIAQNSGRLKLWRVDCFRVLTRKMMKNLQYVPTYVTLATLVNL